MSDPVLRVRDLTKVFSVRRKGVLFGTQPLYAVNGISFDLHENEVLGIVGESGCGKSTLGRLILRLVEPSEGKIVFSGKDLRALSAEQLRQTRVGMQMVFQDPIGSLNPMMSVGQSIEETLRFHGIGTPEERRSRALEMLEIVGLSREHYDRKPHEMSGGQNQRIGIARALVVNPKLLVMDEAVSALDVSVQAQILKLIEDIRRDFKISVIFISHDLSVVRRVSDRVAVLYMGKVMEIASTEELFTRAKHPYTKGLLAARPSIDPKARATKQPVELLGDLPSPLDLPSGCAFSARCPVSSEICHSAAPELITEASGRSIACHHSDCW